MGPLMAKRKLAMSSQSFRSATKFLKDPKRVSYVPKCEGSYLQSEQNQNFNDPLWIQGYLKFFMSEGKIKTVSEIQILKINLPLSLNKREEYI